MHHVLLMALVVLLFPAAHAAEEEPGGQIAISGVIRNNVCRLTTDSQSLNVALNQVDRRSFPAPDSATPAIPFALQLTDCGDATSAVTIAFTGTADTGNPALLKLNGGESAAQGVALEILDQNKTPLAINGPGTTQPLNAGSDNMLQFYARYHANGLPVSTGEANAVADFSLTYQ